VPWVIQYYFVPQLPEFFPFAVGVLVLFVPAIVFIYKKKSKIMFLTYFLTVASLGFTYSLIIFFMMF
jgi:hypothetical protein